MGPDGPVVTDTDRLIHQKELEWRLAAGKPHALRLRMARAVEMVGHLTWRDTNAGEQTATPSIFGDVVLARKDVPTSYHLAVTVDDALQGITVVTRGEDLFHATHVHRLLQALLDLPVPDYRHHRLLVDEHGQRFAKRNQPLTLRTLRETGSTPEDIRTMVGMVS